jgi:hypothetical protein
MALEQFKAPALPFPPQDYERTYFDQLTSVLRIYFNQLDSDAASKAFSYRAEQFIGGLFSGSLFSGGLFSGDGYGLKLPHIAASDSTDQVATGNNTATVVKWNTLDSGYGWTLNSPGSATADVAGVYTIRYSLQYINTANAIHYVDVWLKLNNNNVANSTTRFFVPARKSGSAGQEGYLCAYSEATFSVGVGDEIELYWATDLAGNPTTPTNGVYMFHDAASASPYSRPAIPSAIGSITFVSALLPVPPVTPPAGTVSIVGAAPTVT